MSSRIEERRPIRLRHLRPALAGDAGAVKVLERYFAAADPAGVNGRGGWVSGTFELRLLEEGRFSIRLPNDVGADGVAHADRFAIVADPAYEAGDEWLEVWDAVAPGLDAGGPLFVGTPTDVELSDAIDLSGFDALELMKTVHETAAGFWAHAPRDVFEAYTHAWVPDLAETFDDPAAIGAGGRFVTLELRQDDPATAGATVAAGKLTLKGASNHSGTVIVETADPIIAAADSEARIAAGFRVESALSIDYEPNGTTTPVILQEWGLAKGSWVDAGSDAALDTLVSGVIGRDVNGIWSVRWRVADPANYSGDVYQRFETPDSIALAMEVRGRWVYCYCNGALGAVLPRWPATAQPLYLRAYNFVSAASAGPPYNLTAMSIEHWLVRSRRPFLLRGSDRGSYRLPGAPQPGGLIGSYFDDRDLVVAFNATRRLLHSLKPGREPVARRLDEGIGPSIVADLPPGVPADSYAVRWTGAINLNLATRDIAVRLLNLDDGARVWIGKTRFGEEYLNDWNGGAARTITGGSLRAHLGVSEDGWYPIVVEYFQNISTAGLRLEWATRNGDGSLGTFVLVPPATDLSPQGIYEASVRGDSHYEQLQEMGRTFGLQWTLEPRSLESGLFPGELRPRVRVGADTERIITGEDLTDGKPTRTLAAREVVQGLILDAAGLAADGAQLSLEQLDFPELGQHLLIHEDLVSLSDITIAEVLKARARTLQTLRSSALEEVAFRPRGSSELVDTFPLTGALTRLAWAPGLGVRLRFPRIRIDDATPRQLIAVQRAITPAALGPPEVSFRARPRSPRAALRALARSFGASQRQFQGQITTVQGNVASNPTSATLPDNSSRVPWPTDSARVISAELVIHTKSDASAWSVLVNNVDTGLDFTSVGRIPLDGFVRREGGNQRCFAAVSGGTGTVQFQLELKVRI